MIAFKEFERIYNQAVNMAFQYWTPEMQKEIAMHNISWNPEKFDFSNYLNRSSIRFYKAYRSFAEKGFKQSICDIGGFWGVWPMTLKYLGFENVAMTESLKYYSKAFDALFKLISENGVKIIDVDLFDSENKLSSNFDVITVMAVLEHYPYSLKLFIENIKSILKSDGKIYIEVPNIAYWPKRIDLLFGKSPLADAVSIYKSKVPFIGHHHEYTIRELRELVKISGLSIISENHYNYSNGIHYKVKTFLNNPFYFFVYLMLKDSRECLSILCALRGKE